MCNQAGQNRSPKSSRRRLMVRQPVLASCLRATLRGLPSGWSSLSQVAPRLGQSCSAPSAPAHSPAHHTSPRPNASFVLRQPLLPSLCPSPATRPQSSMLTSQVSLLLRRRSWGSRRAPRWRRLVSLSLVGRFTHTNSNRPLRTATHPSPLLATPPPPLPTPPYRY